MAMKVVKKMAEGVASVAKTAVGQEGWQKRSKTGQAVAKAKGLGVASGSAGVAKMAKKMSPVLPKGKSPYKK